MFIVSIAELIMCTLKHLLENSFSHDVSERFPHAYICRSKLDMATEVDHVMKTGSPDTSDGTESARQLLFSSVSDDLIKKRQALKKVKSKLIYFDLVNVFFRISR